MIGSVFILISQNIINQHVQREIAELPLLRVNLESDVKIYTMHYTFIVFIVLYIII
jgi:hypothetical protein